MSISKGQVSLVADRSIDSFPHEIDSPAWKADINAILPLQLEDQLQPKIAKLIKLEI